MSETLRILLLEDRAADAELVTHALRQGGFEFVATRAATERDFLAGLRNSAPHLILADYSLPTYNGLAALAAAQEQCPETPFIFVSGSLGEERAIETLHRGATDYVLKDRLARLEPAVRRALREREEVRKREEADGQRREAETRFRTLFEQSPDGIVIIDPATARILEFNGTAHRQLGYSREEFARLTIPDLEAAEAPEETRAKIAKVIREGKASFETRQRTRQGEIKDIHVTAQMIEVLGRPVYHCIWRDITERKQAEARVRDVNLMLRASGAINALMVRERDPRRLLAEACKILVETRGYRLAWIGKLEPGSKRVLPAAKAGKNADFLDSASITWDETPTGQGPIGTAIRTGQPIACLDTATDPIFAPWKEAAKEYGLASMAAIPLIDGSRTLGTVAVYSDRSGMFDAGEIELLVELASDLAFALQSIEHEQERRRAEERLRESEQRYRLLFNSGHDAVFVHAGPDAQGRPGKFLEVNDVACKRLGYTREELLQLSPVDIDAPESAQAIPETMRRLTKEKHGTWEAVNLTKKGDRFPVEISSELFDLNGKPTFLSIIRDITERKRTEARLHLLREALESAANAIVITDREGTIIWANTAFMGLSGYSLEEVIGRKPSLFKSGQHDQAFYQQLWEKVLAGRVWSAEMVNRRKDGSLYSEENTITPVRNEKGEITHFIAVKQDITARKQAELRIGALSKLGQRLSAAKTVREAAVIITEVADELLGWDACSFSLFSASRELLDHVLQVDTVEGRRVEENPGYEPPSEMAWRTIESGAQLVVKEEPDQALPGTQPFGDSARPSASILYVPVRQGAEVVGIMSIHSYTRGAYDERSLETLQALADHCGGALERLRMEEAWQNSQRQLAHLLTQSPAVIYSLKTDGKTAEPVWVSDNVERLLGYTAAECHGPEGLFNQVHPGDRQAGIDGLVELFAAKQVVRDYRVRHKNGEYRWVRDEQRLVCDGAGAPAEIVGSWTDVTERKRAEQGQEESERRFREMLENVELIAMTLDTKGEITFCNDYLLRVTGWQRAETMGVNWFSCFIPESNPEVKETFLDNVARRQDPESLRESDQDAQGRASADCLEQHDAAGCGWKCDRGGQHWRGHHRAEGAGRATAPGAEDGGGGPACGRGGARFQQHAGRHPRAMPNCC